MEGVSLEPPYFSRNTGFDDDDEAAGPKALASSAPLLTWSPSAEKELKGGKYSASTLIVTCSKYASAAMRSAVPVEGTKTSSSLRLLGSIVLPRSPPALMNAGNPDSAASSCLLYSAAAPGQQGPPIILAIWPSPVRLDDSFDVAAVLLGAVDAKSVVVLDTIIISTPGDQDIDPRALWVVETASAAKESKQNRSSPPAYLRPPRLLTGLSAALIAACEVSGSLARAYVAQRDATCDAEDTAMAFADLLDKLSLPLKPQFRSADARGRRKCVATALAARPLPPSVVSQGGAFSAQPDKEAPPPEGVYA